MPESSSIERAVGAARADLYDDPFASIHAIKELIHLMDRVQLGQLPSTAHILGVGAGTGAEARFLAPVGFCSTPTSAPTWKTRHSTL
jgi:tRNA (cmo5U34)-methyltransferase